MGMIKEFREFALKGNFVDMAVGIVVGGAVGSVVGSMVNDLITPIVSVFTGGVNFSEHAFTLKEAADPTKNLLLKYGSFVQTFVNFLILMFVVFVIVKVINTAKSRFEKQEAAAGPPEDIRLLTEIRDALVKR